MIDPANVIKFDRTEAELELWWLFSLVVAGKTAKTQARLLDNFLRMGGLGTPFEIIEKMIEDGNLLDCLKLSRLGQFNRLEKAFCQSVYHLKGKLATCTVQDLETIHGVGPKTARMFVMHSRPNQRVAALDTHVLKHLRANGYPDAPLVTPGSAKKYRELEQAFLALADAAGQSPSVYDLEVWKLYSNSYEAKAA
jgi:hypothetical protein